MAEIKTSITETRNEITQTVSKTLESQSATIQQIQRVQTDTNDDLAALYMLKVQKTKDGIPYVAGIGAGIEDTDGQTLSNILLQADRIAMINPQDGNTTPLFVAQGNQLFMNDVFLKRLFAVSITSSGNPPAFSLTPEGKLTARNADIGGTITANAGVLNNVTIAEDCVVHGTITGDIVKGCVVDMGQGSYIDNQLTFRKTVVLKDNMPFDRKLMLMAYSFGSAEFIMKINDRVVLNAKSQQVQTGTKEVAISKNASKTVPVYSDVGGTASGSWDIPKGEGDSRIEITFRYTPGVLVGIDITSFRIPEPVLFFLKAHTGDFEVIS
ncbi:TPA: DUF1983 domain-containing protein [Escherichia coli]|nr:DUF1983 domain-containing protein [Escherichia coli]